MKALDRFWATLEMRVLPLFSFKIIEPELYSSHNVLISCDMPGWFFSAISFQICKHCFAILSCGGFCKWIQHFNILISMVTFKDNLPSSFLAATFGHCLFIPNDCFTREDMCFFNNIFFPVGEIIFVIDTPYLWTIEENGLKKSLKKFICGIRWYFWGEV